MLVARSGNSVTVTSHDCDVMDLCVPFGLADADRSALALGNGGTGRWSTYWKIAGSDVVCPVRDLGSLPLAGIQPVRRFTWRTRQRHRPGLQYLVSTGRHHGFESIAEQWLLVALDFAGSLIDVIAQPFRLRFGVSSGSADHVPDFLVIGQDGVSVFDVRPASRVRKEDRVRFAATAELALACGWRYDVITGWRPYVLGTLGTVSAQRRPLADPWDLQPTLLAAAGNGPVPFGAVVEATVAPPVARAHALHLIWRRRLSIDLAAPLSDRTLVRSAEHPAGARGRAA